MTKDHRKDTRTEDKKAPSEQSDHRSEKREEKKLVYVHEPGTVHLSAYESNVQEAEERLRQAEDDVDAAKRALEDKKANSTFVEE